MAKEEEGNDVNGSSKNVRKYRFLKRESLLNHFKWPTSNTYLQERNKREIIAGLDRHY